MDWDDLPGDSANNIADAESELAALSSYLDRGDESLELPDVAEYLHGTIRYLTDALAAVEKAG